MNLLPDGCRFRPPITKKPIYLLSEGMKFEVITTKEFDNFKKLWKEKYTGTSILRKERHMRKKEIIEQLERLNIRYHSLDSRITELEINTRKYNIPIIDKDGNPVMISYDSLPYNFYNYSIPITNKPKTETLKLMDLVEAILNHLNVDVKKVEEQSLIVLKPRKE